MKTEVYSWRVSTNLKTGLEREARRRKVSLSAVLDMAAEEWLLRNTADGDEEEQQRLQQAAAKYLGVLAGGRARRSEGVRQEVRARLRRRHGR